MIPGREGAVASAVVSQVHEIADEHRAAADAALEVLLDPALEPIVDMVLTRRDGGYEALTPDGRVTFRRAGAGDFDRASRADGPQPARRPVDRQVHAARRRAGATRTRTAPTTPTRYAYDQIAQLFDSPAAPTSA